MTPRISPSILRRPSSSLEDWRENGTAADLKNRAFWTYVSAGNTGRNAKDALSKDELALMQEELHEFRVLSKGSSGGGFLVPTDLAEAITSAARAAVPVAQLATEFVTKDGGTFGVAVAGTHGSAGWLAESGSYTPSDETITQASLSAFKAATKIRVSEELLTDEAVNLDAYLAAELGGRIGALQGSAFAQGSGSGQPLGLVTTGNGISITTAATGSTTRFTVADLKAFFKAVPVAYRATSSWLIAADDFAELAGLTDSAGQLAIPSLSFDPPSIFGRPVYIDGYLPGPAANAKSLVVGDFRIGYGIRRVNGVALQRQEELHSDVGEVGYRAFARVDGRPLLTSALVIGQHSAT